jgi:hypothetical protein
MMYQVLELLQAGECNTRKALCAFGHIKFRLRVPTMSSTFKQLSHSFHNFLTQELLSLNPG